MKIAALQLSTLPLSNSKLNEYLKNCQAKGIRIVVLGEYVLNNFFKDIEKMPKILIKEQSAYKIEALESYAILYNLTIVAPLVIVENNKVYKTVAKFSPTGTTYRKQAFLINDRRWNEEAFFDNEMNSDIEPMIFEANGLTFGVINGFEIHFDALWLRLMNAGVNVVLLPTVSTFGSNLRWNEILKTRAFLNGLYILRVNRIGSYHDKNTFLEFYGETYLVNPDGNIESSLTHQEDMLIASIDKRELKSANQTWQFKDQLKQRGLLV
jgi:nitrilase